jgi:hypothetical protein
MHFLVSLLPPQLLFLPPLLTPLYLAFKGWIASEIWAGPSSFSVLFIWSHLVPQLQISFLSQWRFKFLSSALASLLEYQTCLCYCLLEVHHVPNWALNLQPWPSICSCLSFPHFEPRGSRPKLDCPYCHLQFFTSIGKSCWLCLYSSPCHHSFLTKTIAVTSEVDLLPCLPSNHSSQSAKVIF